MTFKHRYFGMIFCAGTLVILTADLFLPAETMPSVLYVALLPLGLSLPQRQIYLLAGLFSLLQILTFVFSPSTAYASLAFSLVTLWAVAYWIPRYVHEKLRLADDAFSRESGEHAKTKEALLQAQKAARTAELTKHDFLAGLSHEIRTPMNGIMGMTELMLETRLTPEQYDYAKNIDSCMEDLITLVNDLLDYTRIKNSEVEIDQIDFDLRNMMDDVIDNLYLRAEQRGLDLVVSIPREVPSLLRGDPGHLRQILANLGNNAIKFTHKGRVTIDLELEKEDEQRATLLFKIKDTGIGIPEDRRKNIFGSFNRVDNSSTREYGGVGIGLAICNKLVSLMGGELGVTSEVNKGSTFWLRLDLERQKAVKITRVSRPTELTGQLVLVVDSDEACRGVACEMLSCWDIRVKSVSTPEDALSILRSSAKAGDPVHIILMDFNLKGIAGRKLSKIIKQTPELRDTIMILLTTVGYRGDAALARDQGFAAYLHKPIKQSMLYDCLVTVLYHGHEESSVLTPIVTRHGLKEARRRRGRILLVEDLVVNQMVVLKMLTKMGYHANAVYNGEEALRVLGSMPYDLVLMDCHMPVMDGFQATKEIRRGEEKGSHIPIIALTAEALKGAREKCLESGMDEYLSKPVRSADLKGILEQFIPDIKEVRKNEIHDAENQSNLA